MRDQVRHPRGQRDTARLLDRTRRLASYVPWDDDSKAARLRQAIEARERSYGIWQVAKAADMPAVHLDRREADYRESVRVCEEAIAELQARDRSKDAQPGV